MTREEAREILTHNWTRVDNPNYSESELDEAFFMAIEALQAEQKYVADLVEETVNELLDSGDWRVAISNKHKPADAVQGEWNTGKPTKGGKYIVTLIGIGNYRFVDIMHYDKPCMPNREVSGECWYRDDDEWGDVVYDDKDIIAWMPLPKPYKGGEDE